MANEWRRKNNGSDPSDKQAAATLAAALIAHGFTLRTADNGAMVDHAVELYDSVLNGLSSSEVRGEPTCAQGQAVSTEEQQEMDTLGVTRIDSTKFCYREYRYDNLSDALRYARARSGAI